MRIGLAVDALSPHLTGIGRYTWELCQGLASHAAISDIAYFRFGKWVRDPKAFLTKSGDRTGLIKKMKLPHSVRKWLASGTFRERLFHGTNFFLPDQVSSGIVTVHDLSVLRYPDTHPLERVKAFERHFKDSIARAIHIITDSETMKQELVEHLGIAKKMISAVPLGVDTAFRPMPHQGRSVVLKSYNLVPGEYVLCVATLEPRKRIDSAILAHCDMCDRLGINIPLVLVGATGWRNAPLHDLIDQQYRRGQLRFLGFVDDIDLPAIYAGARLFIYPSIYEGFGLPPIEAMSSGVPTIVANQSCLPEVTQGAAMLINPNDIDQFSRAIEYALSDETWRTSAIQQGLAVAAHYTWQRCVEETINVYQSVY